MKKDIAIILCCHCGNITPHLLLYEHIAYLLYDELDDEDKIYNDYSFKLYKCGTCDGASLLGGFEADKTSGMLSKRLYPRGALVLPEAHMLFPPNPIPEKIIKDYEEVWPLRHRAPNAFVSQIRRLLEAVCQDKGAEGNNLLAMLKSLEEKGYLPGNYIQLADILRQIGNIGAHVSEKTISTWDAEIVDELFQELLSYVYVSPAKLARLKIRVSVK